MNAIRDFLPSLFALLLLSACGAEESPASLAARDHAVYTAVVRDQFLEPEVGEHGLACGATEPGSPLTIVGLTQPLPPRTPAQDALWATYLPAPAAPLMAALRALDGQPRRPLDRDGFAVGVPVHLVPATMPGRAAPPLIWFSRVVYTARGDWALVYAVQRCPGMTDADAADAEPGAYETVFLAAVHKQREGWEVHDPLFLDVGRPRLDVPRR